MQLFWKFCVRLIVSSTAVGLTWFVLVAFFAGFQVMAPLMVLWLIWPVLVLGVLVYSLAAFAPEKKAAVQADMTAGQGGEAPPSVG